MNLIDVGLLVVVGYFLVTGLMFLLRPDAVSFYDMASVGPAGRTEVRCYYGALALGIGSFMAYLGFSDLGREALVGTLFIASAIFVVRVVGTAVDGGWSERYTRTAIPVEAGFVVALAAVLALG